VEEEATKPFGDGFKVELCKDVVELLTSLVPLPRSSWV